MVPPTKRKQHCKAVGQQGESNQSTEESEDDDKDYMEVEEEGDEEPENFKDRITKDNMSDLFELCKAKCPVKYLSTIVYLSLRSFGVSWANCDAFLRNMGKVVNF
jgi:hypothetical protein